MYRLTPLTGRLHERWRRFRGLPTGLKEAAHRSWGVSPAVERRVPEALYDAEDLQRITGVAPDGNTIERQIARARGGVEHHLPTTAFAFRNMVLSQGHLYSHRTVLRFGFRPVPKWLPECDLRIDAAALASSNYGMKYFGHWMSDDLPLALAARSFGRPVSMLDRPTPQQRQYLQVLGLDFEAVSNARISELTMLEDFAQNDYKRERYGVLRELARRQHSPERHPGVMLLRGSSGERRVLVNESEVAAMVQRRGFRVIDPQRHTASEIIAACLDTKIVLGVEGSQIANGLMWMDPTGTLVIIQPPARFNIGHKDRCDAEAIRFAFIVGEPRSGQDFEVDLSRLERLLDRVA